jgi:tetratricopeptide (TPR) repeat protein
MIDTEMTDKTLITRDAQRYLSKGQIDKAIAEWEKLIKEAPDGNTHNIIGDLYIKKGDKKNAGEAFHRAAKFFRYEGFSLKALALYKKVLNINQADAGALYALGELSEEKGLATDAIKYYLAAADSFSKEGKKERILDIYERILSLSPTNVPLRNKVAEIFLREGLQSDALKEYIYIAQMYDEKGDIQKSKEYYQKVVDLNPAHKEALLSLGLLCEKAGERETAVEHLKKTTELFPGDTEVILKYAELLLLAGHNDTARDYLSKIIEATPEDKNARRLLAELKLRTGLKEEAWADYLPVIDGIILEEKYGEAIQLLEPFRDLEPLETGKRFVSLYRQMRQEARLAIELTHLGDALVERGLKEDALLCYRDALAINPDDAHVKEMLEKLEGIAKAKKEAVTISTVGEEKTAEEIFIEADIFSRYGLSGEATRLLEALKVREPKNIDVHARLKSLYVDAGDKESAITECLSLIELYKLLGDTENSVKMVREASEIYPDDPRLAERGFIPQSEAETAVSAGSEGPAAQGDNIPNLEDHTDEIAEADFYARQGLTQEASKILERLNGLFPENREIQEKLDNLGQISTQSEMAKIAATPEGEFETDTDKKGSEQETVEDMGQPSGIGGYEDLMFTDQDLVDAQEMPEPALDNEVLEIFQEFKKGLEKEIGNEDSETHYNLGIAYKEMGLVDDAITEFQIARIDPERFISSSTMLGICYLEKALYPLAINVLTLARKNVSDKDESYWAIGYDLAEAYERNNNLREALDLFTGVYGWNAKFRNVSEKVSHITVQLSKNIPPEKPKVKRDRVSYL